MQPKKKNVTGGSGTGFTSEQKTVQEQFSVEKTIALIMAGIYKDFVEKRIETKEQRVLVQEHFIQAINL